eukprot:TRINITY_DN4462_c0_g1_i1.p1 TRINITY_DN4462_c0_g1~~TRINITY_DN4462_c0_g1_i1.p1  ORF type:complete len:263 (-),score=35.03 TRINITY_DN4462_c0_g1_i1:16-738(-)
MSHGSQQYFLDSVCNSPYISEATHNYLDKTYEMIEHPIDISAHKSSTIGVWGIPTNDAITTIMLHRSNELCEKKNRMYQEAQYISTSYLIHMIYLYILLMLLSYLLKITKVKETFIRAKPSELIYNPRINPEYNPYQNIVIEPPNPLGLEIYIHSTCEQSPYIPTTSTEHITNDVYVKMQVVRDLTVNETTAMIVSKCALALLHNRGSLKLQAGICTPSTLLGERLIEELNDEILVTNGC